MMFYIDLWLVIGLATAECLYRSATARGRLARESKDNAGAYLISIIIWPAALWLVMRGIARGR